MKDFFHPILVEETKQRILRLRPESERQWGSMAVAQTLAHCTAASAGYHSSGVQPFDDRQLREHIIRERTICCSSLLCLLHLRPACAMKC